MRNLVGKGASFGVAVAGVIALLMSEACSGPGQPTRGPGASVPSASDDDERGESRGADPMEAGSRSGDEQQVAAVLDDWHDAAAAAEEDRYFGHFTDDAVFLGTDPLERWTLPEFKAAFLPNFEAGSAWTVTARDRFVTVASGGQLAWVDELLDHAKYGVLRGTAVLRRESGQWRIAHYSMTFAVPNAAADAVVRACAAVD